MLALEKSPMHSEPDGRVQGGVRDEMQFDLACVDNVLLPGSSE